MTYHFDSVRQSSIPWPNQSVATLQFYRRQDIYKTNPGTKRSETPYYLESSQLTAGGKYHKSGVSDPWYPTCRGTGSQSINGIVLDDVYALEPRALNRARSDFIEACRESRETSIGSSLGELDQALRMIGDRAKQLLSFGRNLRAGRIRQACSVLGLRLPKGWRKQGKSLGDLWLEFHFGWVPLLGDIYDGMELISKPLSNDGPVRGRGRAKESLSDKVVYSFDDGSQSFRKYVSGSFEALVELRSDTRLTNPNLDLLQNLGIINPLSVAWELTPFSFLVDHVVDIGSFLNSFSDELGWDCVNVGQSKLSVCRSGSQREVMHDASRQEVQWSVTVSGSAANMTRSFPGSLPPYILTWTNPFTGLSAPRAATYIALLLQVM